MPNPLISSPPFVTPSSPKCVPGGAITLTASGGSGGPYTWSLFNPQSGGNIIPTGLTMALYTADPNANALDTVTVTDSVGTFATRDVQVMVGPTLGSLRTDAKTRCDLLASNFITDAEWNKYINGGYFELYDRLISAYDNDYNVADPYAFMTDGLSDKYPLPPDFYKLMGLDIQVATSQSGWMPVPKVNFAERNKWAVPYQVFYGIRSNLHYRLSGNWLWLMPIPSGGQVLRVHYIPRMTQLVADTDILDGISGWEEYVILDACVKARTKREEDASDYRAAKSDMSARIDQLAENRDTANPGTITDTRGQDDGSTGSSNGGFWGP